MGVGAKSGCTSNVEYRSMAGLEAAAGHTAMFRVYTSPERDRILQFCGWGGIHAMSRERSFSIGGGGEAFLQDLFDSRQAERAAAIALFTLRLRMAVQILTRAASISEDKSHLQLTALALAGYPGVPLDRDAWGLWHVRAQTNALYLKRSQNAGKITSQVYITCTYCARSIWAGAGGRMRQRMHKLGSCPSCKRPLPRCALCRLNVGVPLASDQDPSKPNKFASWFAWCQSCRHGGHAQQFIRLVRCEQ